MSAVFSSILPSTTPGFSASAPASAVPPVSDLPPRGGAPAVPRPPKAPPPRKAREAAECQQFEQLPNIGPSIAADLRLLGLVHPRELAEKDALQLYQQLCRITNKRHDPCVLDTFMAATDFMRGAAARPWWDYTTQRKQQYGAV